MHVASALAVVGNDLAIVAADSDKETINDARAIVTHAGRTGREGPRATVFQQLLSRVTELLKHPLGG